MSNNESQKDGALGGNASAREEAMGRTVDLLVPLLGDSIATILVTDNRRVFAIENQEFPAIRQGIDIPKTPAKDSKEAVEKAWKISLARQQISLNTVRTTVLDRQGRDLFTWTFRNEDEMPASEEAAYHELLDIFTRLPSLLPDERTQHQLRRQIEHARVLAILNLYPSLACRAMDYGAEEYYDYDVLPDYLYDTLPPLCLMLASTNAPDLETVQAVYDLNPQALAEFERLSCYNALHFALSGTPCDAVVEFIYSTDPSAINELTDDGYPMDFLLRGLNAGTANLSTLNLLMKLCPEMEVEFGHNLLEAAFFEKCSYEVLKAIASRIPPHIDSFMFPPRGGSAIDRSHISIIRMVLPYLRTLDLFDATNWSVGALEMLVSSLARNKSIVELRLPLLPRSTVCKLFKLLLERNTTLKYLTISMEHSTLSGDESVDCTEAIKSILVGLSANTSLIEIDLRGFQFPSWQVIPWQDELERNNGNRMNRALRSLFFNTESIHQDFIPEMLAYFPTVANALSLSFKHRQQNPFPWRSRMWMLDQLTSLSLAFECAFDGIHIICNALKQNASLQSLSIDFTSVDETEARKCFLDVLKEHNATLNDLTLRVTSPYKRMDLGLNIEYYLDLNFFGRKAAQATTTDKAALLELLDNVFIHANPDWAELQNKRFNVHYGLLREAPSLWVV